MSKRILITGARSLVTLDLARHLNAVGHEVFVADPQRIHFSLFSNAVKKNFTLPSPRFAPNDFAEKILEIATTEKIDLIIPIFEEVFILSKIQDQLPTGCEIFCSNFETLHILHNKWLFTHRLHELGILSPESQLIRSQSELKELSITRPKILKPCYSRGSMNIERMDPGGKVPSVDIQPQNPWIAQDWLEGKKYCSYSICRDGKVQGHSVYPFLFIQDHYCLRFEAVEHPKILHWVKNFVKLENFTGHIAFDFIETADGLFAIECNPRATFGFNLFEEKDQIHKAFLERLDAPIEPTYGSARQVAAAMAVYGWRKSRKMYNLKTYFKKLFSTKDISFNRKDLGPFLFQPLVFLAYFYRAIKYRRNFIDLYLFDMEWNGDHEEELSEPKVEALTSPIRTEV